MMMNLSEKPQFASLTHKKAKEYDYSMFLMNLNDKPSRISELIKERKKRRDQYFFKESIA